MGKFAESVETSAESAHFVEHILASRHFTKAPLLSAFLSYTCRRVFEEGAIRISEREIGIHVFHRDANYDRREDNIVRNYARQLRKRLDEYYATEGSQDSVQLTYPKGGYIPVFVPRVSAPGHVEDDPELTEPPLRESEGNPTAQIFFKQDQREHPSEAGLAHRVLSISCLVLTVLVTILLFLLLHPLWKRDDRVDTRNMHPLWSRVFQPNIPTTWVSLDSGLVLMSVAARNDVSLEEYIRRDFHRQTQYLPPEQASEALTFAYRRYTDFVEVDMVHRFDALITAYRSNLIVKFARDVRVNDLRSGNVILHGAPFANPWVEMYEPQMNFVGYLDFEHKGKVAENHGFHFDNKHPRINEPSRYSIVWNDPKQPLLGSIAFLPGLDNKGVVLIVQGSSLAASEAVQDYLLNDDAFLPFLKSIRKKDGRLPFFELLLESHEVDGTPGSCTILTYHVY